MNKSVFALILVTTLAISVLSIYIHTPGNPLILDNWGFRYSDIVYGVFNPIFRDVVSSQGVPQNDKIAQRWFNNELAIRLLTAEKLCPIPYKDYKFEYPPIVGMLWTISTCTAINIVLPEEYTSVEYSRLVDSITIFHYYIHSVILTLFFVLTVVYMYRMAVMLGLSRNRILLFILLPSTTLYLIYNWDIITSCFIVMAIYYLFQKKYVISGLMWGFSISSKLLPILFVIVLFYDMMQKARVNKVFWSHLTRLMVSVIATGLIPYLIMLSISREGFVYFITHHAQWYCENCVYQLVTHNIWSPYNRIYAMISIAITLLILLAIEIDYENRQQLLNILTTSMIMATALSYVFSPQMMLMVTPIAVLALKPLQRILLLVADIANFGIMTLFFKDAEVRSWIYHNLGIKIGTRFAPHVLDSPVQIFATIRNIMLIVIMLSIIYELFKSQKILGHQYR